MRFTFIEFGELANDELAMLVSARNVVMMRAIRPGIESTGITNVTFIKE